MNILKSFNAHNRIDKLIYQNIELFNCFENIYLYGSILNTGINQNDIDILLIYSKHSNEIINTLNIIHSTFKEFDDIPFHFTILSTEEEREVGFLKRLNSKYLKLK